MKAQRLALCQSFYHFCSPSTLKVYVVAITSFNAQVEQCLFGSHNLETAFDGKGDG